jgi:hypothetical protein
MYRYYQLTGTEEWTAVQEGTDLSTIRPTFVTVLALDTLIDDDTPKELKNNVKYTGPMYFDVDAETIEEALADTKLLAQKLQGYGLTANEMQIFLSGKKGFHILVPQEVFIQGKITPLKGLPAIYKEMAFVLAVDSLDMRVYTAKRGRQFRTCYNIRENDNYKVPVTLTELENLTPETYHVLCKTPRTVPVGTPNFCPQFSILFAKGHQKVSKIRPKQAKPITPEALAAHTAVFKQIASGELKSPKGFNQVAVQIVIFAQTAGWTYEHTIQECQGLLARHESDSSRYNTVNKRRRALQNLWDYLEDNPGMEYSYEALKGLVEVPVKPIASPRDYVEGDSIPEEEDTDGRSDAPTDFAGVTTGAKEYIASKGDDGYAPISNFVFKVAKVVKSMSDDTIISVEAHIRVKGRAATKIVATPDRFTSSSALQNLVARHGGAFSGTDVQARGVWQAMLRNLNENLFALTTEGISVFTIPSNDRDVEDTTGIAWADRFGVAHNADVGNHKLVYRCDTDPMGITKTDLLRCVTLDEMIKNDGPERVISCIDHFVNAQNTACIGRMLGWAVSAFYAPLFQRSVGKFPLLHVYGPAGSGKTEMTRGLMRLFYYKQDLLETSPNATAFALQSMLSATQSIPILMDEYKPHALGSEKLNAIRAVLRDSYNAKPVQRGGGRAAGTHYAALHTTHLTAPLVFVGEAPETETAIVERSLMVSFKRLVGRQQQDCYRHALAFYADTHPLTALGLEIASRIVSAGTIHANIGTFNELLAKSAKKFLAAPEDEEKLKSGEMDPETFRVRRNMRPRVVFASSVAYFGLKVVQEILIEKLGQEAWDQHFATRFSLLFRDCFLGNDSMTQAMVPEYIKVLNVISDMSKLPKEHNFAIVEGTDYNLTELGGELVLCLASAQAYRKYRGYMRSMNTMPLYPSEEAFGIAMRDVPFYLRDGDNLKNININNQIFQLEPLYRSGMSNFAGKPTMFAL